MYRTLLHFGTRCIQQNS